MDEWEVKYRALAAGITDPALIENAERLVTTAINLTTISRFTLREVFWTLLDAIQIQQPILQVSIAPYKIDQATDLSGDSTTRRSHGKDESKRRRQGGLS